MFDFEIRLFGKDQSYSDQISQPAEPGSLSLFWLGQAGFVFRDSESLVIIDPYLSDALAEKYKDSLFTHKRMMQPPFPPDAPLNASYLLSTHAHSDHLDPGGLGPMLKANPECRLICPKSAFSKAVERGAPLERIIPVDAGEQYEFPGFALETIASAHEQLERNDQGESLYLGYIIEMAGLRLYHSGDGVPYPGLDAELARRRIDVALIPVNGRDDFRRQNGVPGNFTIDEAARLCLTAGIKFLVPHHFGLFDFNTVGANEIRERLDGCTCSGLEYWLPSLASSLSLTPRIRGDSRRFRLGESDFPRAGDR